MLTTLKALADATRLRLVAVLSGGAFTVQDLTLILQMGQSRISRHLKILLEAGILDVKRQGTWAYYRTDGENPFFGDLRPHLERRYESLPERRADLERAAAVLEARRRKSQAFFDAHAEQWDDLAQMLLPTPSYAEALLAKMSPVSVLLEVGTGTGGLLPRLARKNERVIGVDQSRAMLDQARRRLAEIGLQNVELRLGEMTHLPLGDGEVESVLLNMVLHHAAQPEEVLREIRRVLAPGGALIIADLLRHGEEWVRERLADQWLGFAPQELATWLIDAGFVEIETEVVRGGAAEQEVLLLSCRTPFAHSAH